MKELFDHPNDKLCERSDSEVVDAKRWLDEHFPVEECADGNDEDELDVEHMEEQEKSDCGVEATERSFVNASENINQESEF
jgi:predicted nucleotidyltransferase component of viral defense system